MFAILQLRGTCHSMDSELRAPGTVGRSFPSAIMMTVLQQQSLRVSCLSFARSSCYSIMFSLFLHRSLHVGPSTCCIQSLSILTLVLIHSAFLSITSDHMYNLFEIDM